MFRVLIDQDSVLYNLHDPWLAQHNRDYPDHTLRIEDHTGWNANEACRAAGCSADMYNYFDNPDTWVSGSPIQNSIEITERWLKELPIELGIVTTAANGMSMPYKIDWLKKYFPHIPNVLISHRAHIKHWLCGDFLIDDGLHNLEHFDGVCICYTQPWNKGAKILRADNWNQVDRLMRMGIEKLISSGNDHQYVQAILEGEVEQ